MEILTSGFIFISVGSLLLLIVSTILLIIKGSRRKFSASTVGTVIGHKWRSNGNCSYPYPQLSYRIGNQDYTCSFSYSSVSYNNAKHAEADWILDEKYGLHIYLTRKCDRHVNPVTEWFPIGSSMPVYYDPSNPKKAYSGGLTNLKLVGLISGGIGALFILLGLLFLIFA